MEVEIPELANERRRIKSLQSWHIDVTECSMGERVAVVLSQIAPQNIDRTLIAEPGVLIANRQLLASFTSIVHFKRSLMSHSKMHLAIGADMVMADVSFLAVDGDSRDEWELLNNCDNQQVTNVLIKFDRNVFTRMDTLLIAARLDAGGDGGKGCRFAFYGRVKRLETNDLRLFTRKMKSGRVERVESNGETLIVTGLFKKETKLELFIGMKLVVEFDLDDEKKRKESLTGDELNSLKTLSSSSPDGKRRKEAVIESSFGKSGKTRIRLVESLTEDELNCLKTLSSSSPDNVKLYFKKFLRDGSLVSYLPT